MYKSLDIEAKICQLAFPWSCRMSINGTSPPVDMTWCVSARSTGSIEEFLSWTASQSRNRFFKTKPTLAVHQHLCELIQTPKRNCILVRLENDQRYMYHVYIYISYIINNSMCWVCWKHLRKNAAETTTTSHGFLQEMLGVCLQKLAELDEAMEARKKGGAM